MYNPEISTQTAPPLLECLSSPKAIENLCGLYKFTVKQKKEAGFVVYSDGSAGPLARQRRPSELEKSIGDDFLGMTDLPQLDFSQHILDRKGDHRRDLLLVLHSHPLVHFEKPADQLFPSVSDLEIWEKLAWSNPNLAFGIAVCADAKIRTLLFKKDPKNDFIPYYQQYDDSERPISDMVGILEKSGIKVATIEFDVKDQHYRPQDSQALVEFLG